MQHSRFSMLANFAVVTGSAFIVGLLFGYALELLLLALLFWSFRQYRQFCRLFDWVHEGGDKEPPEADGHWGELFDELWRNRKRGYNREARLRQFLNRFQQSSTALTDAVVIIDNNNNLEWWNKSAERLLGLRTKTDRQKPVMNLLRDPRFIRYLKRGNYEDPLFLPSPVNAEIDLQYQVTKFGQGDRLLVARDISRLVRLEKTRQDFVANASHELRTPLTVIRGYIETYLDQDLPAPLKRGLSQMEQQSQRMESLVKDLLLLSRLEASQPPADEHPVQVQSMLKHIQEGAIELAKGRNHVIEVQAEEGFDLLGQEQELHSAFSNLAYNAVRYTPKDGHIVLKWWVDDKGGHFSVEDNGIGIKPMHLPRLTERFYRVDESRSSESGGTGLGLAIVKHVLTRHGGQLSIRSKPEKGSVFTCNFPSEHVVASKKLPDNAA